MTRADRPGRTDLAGNIAAAELARLGPYFRLGTHPPPGTARPGWAGTLAEALDRDLVGRRVSAARASLAAGAGLAGANAVPQRVAASVAHLDLLARLVSPFLALAGLHRAVRVPHPHEVHVTVEPGGGLALDVAGGILAGTPGGAPDDAWAHDVVERLVRPVDRAFATLCPSSRTRAGNAASAVHGAVTVLAGHPGVRSEPLRRKGIDGAATALLGHPFLSPASSGHPGTPAFRRRSCCWLYRVAPPPGPGATASPAPRTVCGDCVLVRTPSHP